jgi:hypothetical protein
MFIDVEHLRIVAERNIHIVRWPHFVDEIDEDLIDAEIFAREDSRTFESLNEAIAFIELTTAVKIEDLKPSKGQKWF